MTSTDITLRPITPDEVITFREVIARGFGADLIEPDCSRFVKTIPPERTVAALDGETIVGTLGMAIFDVTIPGGSIPMAGTTVVTVQPTHRRMGVLRSMMREHLEDVRRHDEPLVGLWASETAIYGRYGFGVAAELAELKVDARTISYVGDPAPGRVRVLTMEEARDIVPAIYERLHPLTPGMFGRDETWWEARFYFDPDYRRKGKSKLRYAVYDGEDGPEGYALYRQEEKWDEFPEGVVHVVEVMPETIDAHTALWRLLTNIDLFPHVRYDLAPPDEILPWRVTDYRRVKRGVSDGLWLRILDIPRALAARRYDAEGRVVIGVTDAFFPDNQGAYELEGGPTGAECSRTDAAPDITLDVATLGAAYLGGPRMRSLARAGLVKGDPNAIATADRMFTWDRAPWCPEIF